MWQEKNQHYRVPDDVIEVIFKVAGKTLCKEYESLLAESLYTLFPTLREMEDVAIFLNHAIEEGNGWYMDDDPSAPLYLSRRTRLTLRIPSVQEDALLAAFKDGILNIKEHELRLTHSQSRLLSPSATLYARHIVSGEDDEAAFVSRIIEKLRDMEIRPKRLLPGKGRQIQLDDQQFYTRSLMIADLEKDEAIRLQQKGLGPLRHIGCGVFVPYKSISD
ncbi:MAG: hypothetical protein OEZ43_18300 [Gammaproteobacteria bacterium]|nr:hypothetical protein [Gammaproteobacteria bacterium]